MLKKILLNRKFVPVPIPLLNLSQALHWVESTLVHSDQVITKIVVNGREIVDYGSQENLRSIALGSNDRLEFMIESPMDLALQVIETIRNIASILCQILKPAAVSIWQLEPMAKIHNEVFEIQKDLQMIELLGEQFKPLADSLGAERVILDTLIVQLHEQNQNMSSSITKRDWKVLSKILLNKLEPTLDQMIHESARIQSHLLSQKANYKPNVISSLVSAEKSI